MLTKDQLIKKHYYAGYCRNTNIAQWDGHVFIFINYCFTEPYTETVHYYGDVKNVNIDGFIPMYEITISFDHIKQEKLNQDYKGVYRNNYKNISPKDMPGEIWKPAVEYDRYYQVSNMGRVKKIEGNKIMKQNFSRGYLILGLTNNKDKRITVRVHRLVLFAFKGNPQSSKMEANHINGIKSDNRDVNLEWVKHSDNSQKMYVNNHYNKKLSAENVIEIKTLLKQGELSGKEIASMFKISPSTVSEIKTQKKWVTV